MQANAALIKQLNKSSLVKFPFSHAFERNLMLLRGITSDLTSLFLLQSAASLIRLQYIFNLREELLAGRHHCCVGHINGVHLVAQVRVPSMVTPDPWNISFECVIKIVYTPCQDYVVVNRHQK